MKRFTVIVAMLAFMLASVTANAGFLTDPDSGADVTSWDMEGYFLLVNSTSSGVQTNNRTAAISGTVTFATKGTDSYNMSAAPTMLFGDSQTRGMSKANYWYILNTTQAAGKNSTNAAWSARVVNSSGKGGFGVKNINLGSAAEYGFARTTPDGKMMLMAAKGTLNTTTQPFFYNVNGTVFNLMAQTRNATSNLLAGKWRLFSFVAHNMSTDGANGYVNGSLYDAVVADLVFNSTNGQMSKNAINATLYYKVARNGAFGAGVTLDTATAAIANGKVTLAGDYDYLRGAVMDASSNTLFSSTNRSGTNYRQLNSTGFTIAVRVKESDMGGFTTLYNKYYALAGIGGQSLKTAAVAANTGSNFTNFGVLGSMKLSSNAWAAASSNFTAWNRTSYAIRTSGNVGNGSVHFGTLGMKLASMSSARLFDEAGSILDGANFTGAMRIDGNMYVGILNQAGRFSALAVMIPETSDAPIDLSSLSSDFVTDAQFLAATGLNQCPRANASQGDKCFELSHFALPTSGVNARQVNAITVSTYVQSVIGAADNASIMNSLLFNTTAKADCADHVGNFTSEEYAGAPDELKSMYAFNGTSFLLTNTTNNVLLLAKWVFVANGSGAIGNVAGLTAEDSDPWKFMKKYTGVKNATAYTKVYGNGTLQNWSKFWDADGNVVSLADGVVFYTQYGTNKSLLAPLKTSDTFAAGTKYVLWAVLKNGGLFDLDNSTAFVFDPPRIVTDEEIVTSSSSSSGCVFNPVAGFGLEWLLLLLAPAVGIIRNRFRKQLLI